MDESILEQRFVEGNYTDEQRERLDHLGTWCVGWFGWAKGAKRPLAKRGPGKANDPETEMTLTEALANMDRKGWGGVGVSMGTAAGGVVGIDLDHVIDAGGVLTPFGREAITHFAGGYVEVSPSGTGLRVFVLGDVPEGTPKGSTAIGSGMKAEIYPAGAARFLRITGDTVPATVGEVRDCQGGVEWLAGIMKSAGDPGTGPGPDNVSSAGSVDGQKALLDPGGMSLDAVFDELAHLRPESNADSIIEALQAEASVKPRSKLAEALRGNLAPWRGDWSSADQFMCCEAIRHGAGCVSDVVEVWEASALSKRDKFERGDYKRRTAETAARGVLSDLRGKHDKKPAQAAKPAALPEELSEALTLSGDQLTRAKGGRLAPDPGNVVVLFRNVPELAGLLGFNELAQAAWRLKSWQVFDRLAAAEAGPVNDDDVTRVGMYLERAWGMRVERKELMRALEAAARDASYDPLGDRLRYLGTVWDGVERLPSWLVQWAMVDDTNCAEYVSAVGVRFMVGAVARALSPGIKMDTVLALEGAGGGGKSTLFQVLADAVAPDLFTDGVHDVSSATAVVEATGGRWIVEIAELAGVRRASDIEALKAALTRTRDTHRRPYDVVAREVLRRFVFVATTNRSEYLNDPSGALLRRFWPVRTTSTEQRPMDLQGIRAIAPHLWAEAVVRFQRGEVWHLSIEDGAAYTQWTQGREQRREDGAFHDELVDYLAAWVEEWDPAESGREIKTIARAVGCMRTVEGDQAATNRLADTLRTLGMESRKVGGKKRWRFTQEGARQALLRSEAARRDAARRQPA